MLHVQSHTSRHVAAGVKGLAVLTTHGDDQIDGRGRTRTSPVKVVYPSATDIPDAWFLPLKS
jgi:hypothetical protein